MTQLVERFHGMKRSGVRFSLAPHEAPGHSAGGFIASRVRIEWNLTKRRSAVSPPPRRSALDLTEARRAPESIWTGSALVPSAFISLGENDIILVGFEEIPFGTGSVTVIGARWERWDTEQPIMLARSRELQTQSASMWGNPNSGLLAESDGFGVGVRMTEPPSTTPPFPEDRVRFFTRHLARWQADRSRPNVLRRRNGQLPRVRLRALRRRDR